MNHSKLYLGCAVWSYQGWVGNFYPAKTKPKDFLNLYSQQFNTVEGNTTFYAIPQPKTVIKWANETTEGFKLCPKFPKTVTHQGLLQPKITQGLSFLKIMSGLGDRLGLVFAQLPPSYSPQYIEDLRQFLIAFEQYDLALEVRHPDWFTSPYREQLDLLLTELNIAKVLLDTRPIYNCQNNPQATSQRRKPNVPLQPIVTNNYALIRFISNPERQYNEIYLQEWVSQCDRWFKEQKTVYFFVHCPIEEESPATADYFKSLLQKRGVAVEHIASDSTTTPTQLNLFDI